MDHLRLALIFVLSTMGHLATAEDDERVHLNRIVKVVDAAESDDYEYSSYENDMAQLYDTNEKFLSTHGPTTVDGLQLGERRIEGDENNCWADITVKQPYVLETEDKSTDIVVQLKQFQQTVKWTECKSLKATCFGSVFTPGVSSMDAQCENKYGTISLYVYDKLKKEYQYKMFHLPVACVCKFKRRESLYLYSYNDIYN